MNCQFNLKPGTWANINTNISLDEGKIKEDVVKNPVFVISREEYPNQLTFMCIDQRKNLLVWYKQNHDRFNPWGTIAGSIESQSFQASITSVFLDCIPLESDLLESDLSILPCAEERRKAFLFNNPSMESCFFKISAENNVKPKVTVQIQPKENSALCCPLTLEPFKDPVTAPDGRNYERAAIVEWLRKSGTSPFTKQPMSEEQLISNFALKPD